MANQQLIEDYKQNFQELGASYGLAGAEIDVLRGVYEKVAKKTAEQIQEHINDFKAAYSECKEITGLNDDEMRLALNVEIRGYMMARRRQAIASFAAAAQAAIENYDLSDEECAVLLKYRMAQFAEMMGDVQARFREISSNFEELSERYDLEDEDIVKLVAAVTAANIML